MQSYSRIEEVGLKENISVLSFYVSKSTSNQFDETSIIFENSGSFVRGPKGLLL